MPWLIATYSENGARQLIANTVFGMLGAVFGAMVFDWISPAYSMIALVSVGPVVTFLTIEAGQAIKRAILSKLARHRASCLIVFRGDIGAITAAL